MADISITPANFSPSVDALYLEGVAGVDMTVGQPVYLQVTTNEYFLCDANFNCDIYGHPAGICANEVYAGQRFNILFEDPLLTIGATLVAGTAYVVSAAVGKIAPITDLVTTGEWVTVLGASVDTADMNFKVMRGEALP